MHSVELIECILTF